jgi:TPR repeat protein
MEQSLDHKCAFCRHRLPETEAEAYKNVLKRAQANDPVALRQMGTIRHDGGDIGGAFEYWTKAAALGDATAHYGLSRMYHNGDGVQKDIKKKIYHAEKAAISGHPMARHYLGCHEANSDRIERAVKHFIIAANLGCDNSLKNLR